MYLKDKHFPADCGNRWAQKEAFIFFIDNISEKVSGRNVQVIPSVERLKRNRLDKEFFFNLLEALFMKSNLAHD